jgi:NDP-sugar pyrophosphorylase family protein
MRDEYEITDAIQIFLDDGYRVRAAHVVEDDLNLSYPRDLLDINLHLLGQGNCIGQGVSLPDGCTVEQSVLMDGVQVQHPIRIRQSVVFPGVEIASRVDIERRILTADHVIDCR